MKSRYLQIYSDAKNSSSHADAIVLTLTQLAKDTRKDPALSEKDVRAITALMDDLSKENEIKNIITLLLQYLRQIQDRVSNRLIYCMLQDIEQIYYNTRASNLVQPAPMQILTDDAQDHHEGDHWGETIKNMLAKKNLDPKMFKPVAGLTLDSDLSEHVRWAFENIYSIPYPGFEEEEKARKNMMARFIHGIMHVTRVAIYAPVFANLYRKHGDAEALKLTPEDLKLIQIAALLHDAARESEAADLWDHESGMLIYLYLTRILKADPEKAKMIAAAMANKDSKKSGYFEFYENPEKNEVGYIFHQAVNGEPQKKNIYQKIIHDADSLDIIRARPAFDANYLDFYKDVACQPENKTAFAEMSQLRSEARCLIEMQGDAYIRRNKSVKTRHENEHCYQRALADLNPEHHGIIHALHDGLKEQSELQNMRLVDETPYDPNAGMTDENMNAAMREGKLFVRAVASPSAIAANKKESLAELEIRKTVREPGIETASKKSERDKKHGNPVRSISMVGHGSDTFCNAGFLILEPDPASISKVAAADISTGFGKKKKLVASVKIVDRTDADHTKKVQEKLQSLNTKLMMGGDAYLPKSGRGAFSHSEVLADITRYNAVFFSKDPTLHNLVVRNNAYPQHEYSAVLQAVYLRKLYAIRLQETRAAFVSKWGEQAGEEKFQQRFGANLELPIFEYSGIHHFIKRTPESDLTDAKIIGYWENMCNDYINEVMVKDRYFVAQLCGYKTGSLIQTIKTLAMYGSEKFRYLSASSAPADSFYSHELKQKLDHSIEKLLLNKIMQYKHGLVSSQTLNEENAVYLARFAIQEGDSQFIRALCETYPESINSRNNKFNVLLFDAVKAQQVDIVKMLLKNYKFSVEATSHDMETPLHMAAKTGNVEMIDLLLTCHADLRSLTSDQRDYPIDSAVKAGQLEAFKLLERASVIDAWQYHELLELAVLHNKIDIVRYLLNKKIKKPGPETLAHAAEKGYVEVVAALVAHGANLRASIGYRCAIHYAIERSHPGVVSYMLAADPALTDIKDEKNNSLLHFAAVNDSTEVANMLLLLGMKVDAVNDEGASPLIYAAETGSTEVARLLINNGADINQVFGDNCLTPLSLAARCDSFALCDMLLQDQRTDVNARTKTGATALFYAAKGDCVDIVKLLIKKGAHLESEKLGQITPLYAAIRHYAHRAAEVLLESGAVINKNIIEFINVNFTAQEQMRILVESYHHPFDAVRHKNLKALTYAITNGVDINSVNGQGKTLLLAAVESGNEEMVRYLVGLGANITLADNHGNRPLDVAQSASMQNILLEYGDNAAELEAYDENGLTPLLKAVLRGRPIVAESLLVNGANPNAGKAEIAETAFHIMVQDGNITPQYGINHRKALIMKLVLHGANLNALNKDGKAPVALAVENYNNFMLEMLLFYGADPAPAAKAIHASPGKYDEYLKCELDKMKRIVAPYTSIIGAVKNADIDALRAQLSRGIDIQTTDANGNSLLHLAAIQGTPIVVDLLIKANANKEAVDKEDKTPLMSAVIYLNLHAVELLLEAGAKTDTKDIHGRTVFDYIKNDSMLARKKSARFYDNRQYSKTKILDLLECRNKIQSANSETVTVKPK
jgi:ankyrin repeat protein